MTKFYLWCDTGHAPDLVYVIRSSLVITNEEARGFCVCDKVPSGYSSCFAFETSDSAVDVISKCCDSVSGVVPFVLDGTESAASMTLMHGVFPRLEIQVEQQADEPIIVYHNER